MAKRLFAAIVSALVVSACGGNGNGGGAVTTLRGQGPPSGTCLVRLHGKGGTGAASTTAGDITVISPTGNADGWGAKQWLYFPDKEYAAALAIVRQAVVGCDQVIIDGFSNGASFAAAMYCKGETLDGRLERVVVDDPVTDHAVEPCTPGASVAVTLYATGALEKTAPPGWNCADGDWTCEGGTTIGISAYAQALGAVRQQSPHLDHEPYVDAPEATQFG
ncbi:MAG: hypothetical protein ACXV8L_09210 [Ilumatobacteraceae bacterium]